MMPSFAMTSGWRHCLGTSCRRDKSPPSGTDAIARWRRTSDSILIPPKEKIAFLDRAGIGPTEIGKVLGRTTTHVSKELASLRKKKR